MSNNYNPRTQDLVILSHLPKQTQGLRCERPKKQNSKKLPESETNTSEIVSHLKLDYAAISRGLLSHLNQIVSQ